jgi:hypothetical protein
MHRPVQLHRRRTVFGLPIDLQHRDAVSALAYGERFTLRLL